MTLSLRFEGDLDLLMEYLDIGVISSFSPEKSMQLSFLRFLDANLLKAGCDWKKDRAPSLPLENSLFLFS